MNILLRIIDKLLDWQAPVTKGEWIGSIIVIMALIALVIIEFKIIDWLWQLA